MVAEVGNTRMCVAETSRGVCRCDWMEAWLKRSSGVKRSAMRRRHESGSVDTRHADTMHGTPDGYSTPHEPHSSRSTFDARTRFLRDSSQLQPGYNGKLVTFTMSHPMVISVQYGSILLTTNSSLSYFCCHRD